jgi:hypothetical protein
MPLVFQFLHEMQPRSAYTPILPIQFKKKNLPYSKTEILKVHGQETITINYFKSKSCQKVVSSE